MCRAWQAKLVFGRDVVLLQLDVDDHDSITVSIGISMNMRISAYTKALCGSLCVGLRRRPARWWRPRGEWTCWSTTPPSTSQASSRSSTRK